MKNLLFATLFAGVACSLLFTPVPFLLFTLAIAFLLLLQLTITVSDETNPKGAIKLPTPEITLSNKTMHGFYASERKVKNVLRVLFTRTESITFA